MLQRLLNILKSLRDMKPIVESQVSTTVDDTKEGSRQTFDPKRVRELLEKCELIECSDPK